MRVENFEWVPAGIAEVMKSEEVGAELKRVCDRKCAEVNAEGRAIMHSQMQKDPYVTEIRTLDHTKVGVIHPTTNAGAAIARKHGILTW